MIPNSISISHVQFVITILAKVQPGYRSQTYQKAYSPFACFIFFVYIASTKIKESKFDDFGKFLISGWFRLSALISGGLGSSIDSTNSINSALVGNFYHSFIIVIQDRFPLSSKF